MKLARVVEGGKPLRRDAVVYRLRAGAKGTGRILHEHEAQDYGAQRQASDIAIQDCRAAADRLGYTIEDVSIVGAERYL